MKQEPYNSKTTNKHNQFTPSMTRPSVKAIQEPINVKPAGRYQDSDEEDNESMVQDNEEIDINMPTPTSSSNEDDTEEEHPKSRVSEPYTFESRPVEPVRQTAVMSN